MASQSLRRAWLSKLAFAVPELGAFTRLGGAGELPKGDSGPLLIRCDRGRVEAPRDQYSADELVAILLGSRNRMHPKNSAAWLKGVKVRALEVRDAPYTEPAADEIVLRVHAVALNPIDYMTQHQGSLMFPWIKYPFILGTDVAGEVVQVGTDVDADGNSPLAAVGKVRVGDRVVGFAAGTDEKRNRAAEGGFQHYTVLAARMATRIPDGMTWEQAAVLPMGVTTAAAALFKKDQLGLQWPQGPAKTTPQSTGKDNEIVVIWGGSTSVGSNAIQLAVAAGYEVLTTCSPKNNNALHSLGAARCFDYRSSAVVADIVAACYGRKVAGAVAIGHGSGFCCMDVLAQCSTPGKRKYVAMVSYPMPDVVDPSMARMGASYMVGSARLRLKGLSSGCDYKAVFSSNIIHDEVSVKVWNEFLGAALESGEYKAVPEAEVVGSGLESVQGGLDKLKKGVSYKKLVVKLG
ncbi:chaperonin 10-like protein [Microdochium trichocladiopsis]|uniref:Chaperonin 10-like protein n=1 Tax=Microdochium trichocladiopsis TaxID=1682393 RepID=A0A9P8YGM5_9PEZI|nr:chaperonin 10-like protein [Microdochium trichocladiopsis]KAH7040039.1 chaperonin 10-like protein [Microdochium trichocladiopsis]